MQVGHIHGLVLAVGVGKVGKGDLKRLHDTVKAAVEMSRKEEFEHMWALLAAEVSGTLGLSWAHLYLTAVEDYVFESDEAAQW